VLWAGKDAAAEPTEVLVQRHVNGVEKRRDVTERPSVERPALPEPRAVQVHRDPVGSCPARLRAEFAPRRQLAAEVALRQLQEKGAERLRDAFEVRQRDQPVTMADDPRMQPMEMLIALLLMHVEVALRMKRDCRAARA